MHKRMSLPVRERGLKCVGKLLLERVALSLPVRERGLKFPGHKSTGYESCCRSPCGERGLKFDLNDVAENPEKSLPVRGAWVEIASSV